MGCVKWTRVHALSSEPKRGWGPKRGQEPKTGREPVKCDHVCPQDCVNTNQGAKLVGQNKNLRFAFRENLPKQEIEP